MTPATVAGNVLLALLWRAPRSWRELRQAGLRRGRVLRAVGELAAHGFAVRVGALRLALAPCPCSCGEGQEVAP
jgi:hypothetical protein